MARAFEGYDEPVKIDLEPEEALRQILQSADSAPDDSAMA